MSAMTEQQLAEAREAVTEAPLTPYPDLREAAVALLAEVDQLRGQIAIVRAAGLLEAAEIVDNGDDCDCGGCDTCIPRQFAREIRDRAYSVARGDA